jgi:hypothetical protein
MRRLAKSAPPLLLALLLLALTARAAEARDFPGEEAASAPAAPTAAAAPASEAAGAEDDAASYADRYASDPAGGVISVPPAPLDPSFLPNFNCRKFAVSVCVCVFL